MSLIAFPPKPPKHDADFETLLADGGLPQERRLRRALPAEWAPQSGVWLTWPHEGTDWADVLPQITETYTRLAYEIALREPLLVVHPDAKVLEATLRARLPKRVVDNITFFPAPTDDTWTRDHGVLTAYGTGGTELVDCCFNGWGGKFPAARDNALTRRLYDAGVLHGHYIDALDFVLEGGSIESDGQGTILTTSQCLLTPTRGEGRTRQAIEERLASLFGTERVLWLDHGHLAGDDTDGHIDTLARLCPGGVIAYVRCDDPADEHYDDLRQMEQQLRTFKQPDGRPYTLVPLPMAPVCRDDDGQRLPATYANYLVLNDAVLFPTYGHPALDEQARRQLARLYPKYSLVGIDARTLILQHGSIHCAAMQLPRGVLKAPSL
ncbi:MAG: agmatine deiminase family protein [Bacteroidaceae bacterium]|nr:agmatine deiminase family protein [Bacteroidaceae bacterium]